MSTSLKHSLSLLLLLTTITSAIPMTDTDPAFSDNDLEQQLDEQDTLPKLTRAQRVKKWVKEHKVATAALAVTAAFLTETGIALLRGKDPLVKHALRAITGPSKTPEVMVNRFWSDFTQSKQPPYFTFRPKDGGPIKLIPRTLGDQHSGTLYTDRDSIEQPVVVRRHGGIRDGDLILDPDIPMPLLPMSTHEIFKKYPAMYNRMIMALLNATKGKEVKESDDLFGPTADKWSIDVKKEIIGDKERKIQKSISFIGPRDDPTIVGIKTFDVGFFETFYVANASGEDVLVAPAKELRIHPIGSYTRTIKDNALIIWTGNPPEIYDRIQLSITKMKNGSELLTCIPKAYAHRRGKPGRKSLAFEKSYPGIEQVNSLIQDGYFLQESEEFVIQGENNHEYIASGHHYGLSQERFDTVYRVTNLRIVR